MEKTILLVDDELKIREMFYELFSLRGYKIITASGGEEGIEIMKKEKPDLVLLDIKMQTMDGIEALKRMREFDAKTGIIMLTALEDADLDRQARLNGATGLMRKSWGILTIAKIVSSLLEEKLEFSEDKKRILIADDETQICLLLKDFLAKKGFKPTIASSGEEALEKIKQENPIIVLLDINMPGMDGLMTLKKIKEIGEHIGIIVITGMADTNIAEQAIKLGVYDYIVKPVNFRYLEFCLISKIILSTV
jgi:DNA-binding NtrC family response regulator